MHCPLFLHSTAPGCFGAADFPRSDSIDRRASQWFSPSDVIRLWQSVNNLRAPSQSLLQSHTILVKYLRFPKYELFYREGLLAHRPIPNLEGQVCSMSDLSSETCPARLNLPGTAVPGSLRHANLPTTLKMQHLGRS